MRQIILKPFQEKALESLTDEFLHKWKKESKQTIRFQAPTGSGKTVMMAQFVKELVNDPRLTEANLAFLWVSIGGSKEGDLASQSRKKFTEYYDGNTAIEITGLDDLDRDKVLEQNEILFFNWSKIKTANKDGRKLRREGETEITWDGMLERTKLEDRNIVLIIDEAHRESGSLLAEEEIKQIDPRIILKVTATHDSKEVDVNIEYEEVVSAGLIKEGILSQTQEDFEGKGEQDLDRYVLDLALKKRRELQNIYDENGIDVNPLLMIQLPNDELKNQEEMKQKDIVLGYLREQKVDENKIAVWLTGKDKTDNLANITKNNNDVEVLLFKQAPATGWDCPRAQVMLMYRETKSPVFQVQLLGRILRMPEAKKYQISALNHSYLYTTYTKNEIVESYKNFEGIGPNETKIYDSFVRSGIEQTKLETFVSQRTSYGDLGKTFQSTFLSVAKKYYKNEKSLKDAGFYFNNHLDLNLIVDQKITDYDNFIKNLKKSKDFGQEMSLTDIEKLYKKLCIEILSKQEEESKYGGIARSYGILKSTLNVFFEDILKVGEKKEYYQYIINDLMEGANSILIPIINKSLLEYKEIREVEEKEKDKRKHEIKMVKVPLSKIKYSSIFEKIESDKCAMQPCYIEKDNQNEKDFIKYLEGNNSVIWWYKNGDQGSDYFSVKRDDGRLFFPDWFIKTEKDIWIIDTKSGFTATGDGAKIRARALESWLEKNKKFKGGLVKPGPAGIWQIAYNSDLDNWSDLKL
ncbi:MAG TPA: hypothetical protein ENI76_04980 [Ignavibacteria bacterium]|nr:hypothetical protein [Ignavibacteria bacterium]